jgi:hypothetical protein
MYKNIEILDKKKHNKTKFNSVDALEVAKHIGIVPLGVDEVLDMSCISPVLISGGENKEFIAFTGISTEVTLYKNSSLFLPRFVQTYPFMNIVVKDENQNYNTVVAIDNNKDYVGMKKQNSILSKNGELEKVASQKIELVKKLDQQRNISKIIIKELQKLDLLVQKSLKIKTNSGEQTIINEFYIVNREKLLKLDDAILATWVRKGWIGIIDAHIKSLNNFQQILTNK